MQGLPNCRGLQYNVTVRDGNSKSNVCLHETSSRSATRTEFTCSNLTLNANFFLMITTDDNSMTQPEPYSLCKLIAVFFHYCFGPGLASFLGPCGGSVENMVWYALFVHAEDSEISGYYTVMYHSVYHHIIVYCIYNRRCYAPSSSPEISSYTTAGVYSRSNHLCLYVLFIQLKVQ